MQRTAVKLSLWVAALAGFAFAPRLQAETLKLATIIPDDSAWTNNLKKFAQEVKVKTASRVEIKLYSGGVQGDEPDILRKIRVGQLQGGILTGSAMGSVYSDVRVLELPFNFVDDRALALKVMKDLGPYFAEGFAAKGFKVLGLYEQGKVYIISKKSVASFEEIRKTKFWSWTGDEIVSAMLKGLQFTPINLGLTDVLPSLSTGLVDTVFGPPLGILALQWNTKVEYLLNYPVTYGFGALMLSSKAFDKISKEDQKIVEDLGQRYIQLTNDEVVKGNDEALQTMKRMGMKFMDLPKTDLEQAKKVRLAVIAELTGKVFSKKTFDLFEKSASGK